jgi:hypothetical protein
MRTYAALLSIFVTGISFSQQKDSVKTKTPAFIIKLTHGFTNSSNFNFTNSEWKRMTPGFDVPDSLKSNTNVYQYNYLHSFSTVSSSPYYMFSFALINNKEKQVGKKYRTTTTFNLGYGPELRAQKVWNNENSQVIDTLISTQTGNSYYVNGTRTQTISKNYRSKSIAFGVGQHISTNPNRLFMFETGLDVLCLLSIVSEIKAIYTDDYTINGIPSDSGYGYPSPITSTSHIEEFGGQLIAGMIVRIPLDMSLALSKKNPVMKRMRIGGELNPGLGMQFTKGRTTNNFSISGGMNFRFQL